MNKTESTPARVAVVTGGAGGLGQVISEVLLNDGFRVAMLDLDSEHLKSAISKLPEQFQGNVLPLETDITEEASVHRALAAVDSHWGRLDALINNAGIEIGSKLTDVNMLDWERTFSVNVAGPMRLIKHALPFWLRQQEGTVVSIGSRTWLSGSDDAAYASSKAAIVGLMRSVAFGLGPLGVNANVVAPSFVRTPLNSSKGSQEYVEDYARQFEAMTPLRRLIEPVDVANAVAFLASRRARNITGEVLHVAAGSQMAPAIR
ncbi:SDR family NAD(P)-dependent oxidoreductase [Pseudarthrobacter sp. NPDC055928]|uniref:SDR family NAD(P)-dependent oxidoreductase n=1 Tax=Pseudarthrobacter sp. NPDC055928 TaxID=3345661 RepID=UPI0035E1910E